MLDVTTIGEGQLRLTSGIGQPLSQAATLEVYVAGTEANVAGLLSRLGRKVGLVTALPDNPLGRRIVEEFRAAGIRVDHVVLQSSGRVALYFVEENPPPLPSRVLYDRAGSVFSQVLPDQIDFDYLASSRLLHLTGITAALTDTTRGLLSTALLRAATEGQKVSFDINFRHNLWSPAAARDWLEANITSKIAVLSCARRDAEALYGVGGDARDVPARLADRFGAPTVLVSDGAGPVHCYHDGATYTQAPHPTAVIDRVGAGDALLGGFLHGYLDGDLERGLRLGVAAAALTLARRGEQLRTTEAELEAFCGGDIQR
ncbi:MAG: sugar kinase [Microbacteriaceae bacterium]|nr:MAG: sugar kinase [Microbacteriaceae bacterium]